MRKWSHARWNERLLKRGIYRLPEYRRSLVSSSLLRTKICGVSVSLSFQSAVAQSNSPDTKNLKVNLTQNQFSEPDFVDPQTSRLSARGMTAYVSSAGASASQTTWKRPSPRNKNENTIKRSSGTYSTF